MIVLARGISTRQENAAVAALVLGFALGGGVVAVAAEVATAGLMAAIGASTTACTRLLRRQSFSCPPLAHALLAARPSCLSTQGVSSPAAELLDADTPRRATSPRRRLRAPNGAQLQRSDARCR